MWLLLGSKSSDATIATVVGVTEPPGPASARFSFHERPGPVTCARDRGRTSPSGRPDSKAEAPCPWPSWRQSSTESRHDPGLRCVKMPRK